MADNVLYTCNQLREGFFKMNIAIPARMRISLMPWLSVPSLAGAFSVVRWPLALVRRSLALA